MKSRFLLVSLLFVFQAGCNLARSPSPATIGGPQAWIDMPLDGSVLPLASVAIVAHASDPTGVSRFEYSINGSVVADSPGDSPYQALLTSHQAWTPAAAGIYTLRVRAQNAGGAWGDVAESTFQIAGVETPTTTATPEPTPTITPTVPARVIEFIPVVTPNVFYHSKACGPNDLNCVSTCNPSRIEIRAQVSVPELVDTVVLFFSLAGKKSSTGWNEGVSMRSLGGGIYTYTLPSDRVSGAQSFDEATFKYQFVATDADKNVIGRSQVFSDVTLSVCP